MSKQPKALNKLKQYWDKNLGDPDIIMERMGLTDKSTGEELYRALSGTGRNEQAASEALRELGVPGIKYYDAGSRAAGEGTRNFVIFDENLIDIVE
ncbi:MAG: hypothetical protein GTN99_07085 [Candidatus Dadabacteria bacterium]|nr:hypothetical protein [Candidatus Dadabacteria bacterium]